MLIMIRIFGRKWDFLFYLLPNFVWKNNIITVIKICNEDL